MGYKKGAPLVDRSAPFRLASMLFFRFAITVFRPVVVALYRPMFAGKPGEGVAAAAGDDPGDASRPGNPGSPNAGTRNRPGNAGPSPAGAPEAARPRKAGWYSAAGAETAPGTPLISVSNHCLALDPCIVAGAHLPARAGFMGLEETFTAPVVGTIVRLLGGIPIPRGQGRLEDTERAVREALADFGRVHFFPEGECYLGNQEIRPFKPIAFVFAIRLGVPIQPIVTVLSRRGGRQERPRIRSMTVCLPPIDPPESTGRIATDIRAAAVFAGKVRAAMQEAIDRFGGDKTLYRGPMPRIRFVNAKPDSR